MLTIPCRLHTMSEGPCRSALIVRIVLIVPTGSSQRGRPTYPKGAPDPRPPREKDDAAAYYYATPDEAAIGYVSTAGGGNRYGFDPPRLRPHQRIGHVCRQLRQGILMFQYTLTIVLTYTLDNTLTYIHMCAISSYQLSLVHTLTT